MTGLLASESGYLRTNSYLAALLLSLSAMPLSTQADSQEVNEPRQRSMISSPQPADDETNDTPETADDVADPGMPPVSDPNAPTLNDMVDAVLKRNQEALDALYTRARTTNAELRGWVVFTLTIHSEGHVERCEILRSELDNDRLEDAMCERILLFRFEPFDVARSIRVSKPINFTPD